LGMTHGMSHPDIDADERRALAGGRTCSSPEPRFGDAVHQQTNPCPPPQLTADARQVGHNEEQS